MFLDKSQGFVSPISTEISFFPKDKVFWSYHFGALSLLLVVQIALKFVLADVYRHLEYEVLSFSYWILSFTIAVLIFRFRYLKKAWYANSMQVLVARSLAATLILALLATVFMELLTQPFYWQEVYVEKLKINPALTVERYFIMVIVGNWISTSLFIFSWMCIYIGITNARRIKQSQLDNLRLQNSLKEAQLSSLSNQLNPHFLFNSLNNIRFMIHENANQADAMITALSEVLRYSLESSQHEKLPLTKEIEIIQRYVEIVDIQFEDRLVFKMDIPKPMHSSLVPPMLLQMLVENAVKHGLEQIKEGGVIRVTASSSDDSRVFLVSNTIPEKSVQHGANTGIGLKNIKQRLQLLYGGRARFDTSKENDQFIAKITLPNE